MNQTDKALLLNSLHVPGEPLIVTNVWDAVTARIVADAPGVRALATASHSVSFARGVDDGEGMSVEQALETARLVASAVDIPVSVDFERGYAGNLDDLYANITALIGTGAVGLNFEDSTGDAANLLCALDVQVDRIRTIRAAAEAAGVPLVLNARSDALVRGGDFNEMVTRANAYLEAGADVIFALGLRDEDTVTRAVADIEGRVSVIAGPSQISLRRLAELGIARVSFGPGTLGLTLAHLQAAAAQLTALGDYPAELGFKY